jgi:toxin ParE1/3/4
VRVERRKQFIDDLTEAYAYLAPRSPRAADRLLLEVDLLAHSLSRFPEIGRQRPQLGAGVRAFPVRRFPYVVFYTIEADLVLLKRLLHGARKLTRMALAG